jgi:hypothetical protein
MNNVQYFDGTVITYRPENINWAPLRHCIRETFNEGPAPGCTGCYWLKVWTFHYSDGTMEQLKQVVIP